MMEDNMGEWTHPWHFDVAKLFPKILNSVQADESRYKEADKLNANI
jgi:hypothetical protein